MLSGIYYPDSGEIYVDGKRVVISSPKDAFDLGIGRVHQHFKLIDVFTASENIVLGLKNEPFFLSRRKINKRFQIDMDLILIPRKKSMKGLSLKSRLSKSGNFFIVVFIL